MNLKISSLLLAIFVLSFSGMGQVGINAVGAPPHSSAGLDVDYSDKGFLPPRLTTAQRLSILTPAPGLQIFNVETGCVEFYNGSSWKSMCGSDVCSTSPATLPSPASLNSTHEEMYWSWYEVIDATGYKCNTVNDYSSAVDVGTSTEYTVGGLECNTPYQFYVWAYNACGSTVASVFTNSTMPNHPVAPTASAHTPGSDEIEWNWNSVEAATGYKYNVLLDYETATDLGLTTSFIQTGLNCDEEHHLFIWAYSDCGVSSQLELIESTMACPVYTESFSYTGSDQTWTVPAGVTSVMVKAWGAGGGGGGNSANTPAKGGGGGFVQGEITVTPGEVLTIVVGGGGSGGNILISPSCSGGGGGGGGGRSAVRVISGDLITAAGGGGSGAWEGPGGAGGGTGGATGTGPYPGGGGTASSGGAAGGGLYAGQSGGVWNGGNTYDSLCGEGGYGGGGIGGYYGGGGGGGAGWYGGGGGGAVSSNSGGGGGSSYSTGTTVLNQSGSAQSAANTADPDYVTGVGNGGNAGASGEPGRVVLSW